MILHSDSTHEKKYNSASAIIASFEHALNFVMRLRHTDPYRSSGQIRVSVLNMQTEGSPLHFDYTLGFRCKSERTGRLKDEILSRDIAKLPLELYFSVTHSFCSNEDIERESEIE